MHRFPKTLGLAVAVALAFAPAAKPISADEAHAIGVNAYLYFYSLVTMDLTRKQLTNMEPGPGSLGGPMNRFANIGASPPPTCALWSGRISTRFIPAAGSI